MPNEARAYFLLASHSQANGSHYHENVVIAQDCVSRAATHIIML